MTRYLILTQFRNETDMLLKASFMSHGRALRKVRMDKEDDPDCVCRIFAVRKKIALEGEPVWPDI